MAAESLHAESTYKRNTESLHPSLFPGTACRGDALLGVRAAICVLLEAIATLCEGKRNGTLVSRRSVGKEASDWWELRVENFGMIGRRESIGGGVRNISY